MRTPILATLLGFSLVACAGQIEGGGGGDDDVPPPDCGNGSINGTEQCDDGNNIDGDGCSATCTTEAQPRLDVTVDKPTIATELGTTEMVTVTLTGADGFSGQVIVTPSVVDAANAPLTAWTVTAPQTVDVPLNGTQSVVVSLSISSENKGLAGTLKIDTTSAAEVGTHSATVAVTALNQISFKITSNNNQCVYPTQSAIKVTEGTKVRFVNAGTISLIVHSNGGSYGVDHQDTATTTAPNTAYERTIDPQSADGNAFDWYCHSPGPDLSGGNGVPNTNPKILVTAP